MSMSYRPINIEVPGDVPEVVIMRLPQYIRVLELLEADGAEMVSSQQLGDMLQVHTRTNQEGT